MMSLHRQLQRRAADDHPIRIGLIGAGKFDSMYLARIPRTPSVARGQSLCRDDVVVDTGTDAYRLRRAMEALFAPSRGRSIEEN